MEVFDRYLFRNLGFATFFVALTLAAIILLTQSLRFLELVLESGASGGTFWLLTLLALPRFLEVILPVALMAAIVFIYNRMTMDSELVVMRALGRSPLRLARPAVLLSALVAGVLLVMTAWATPVSLSSMQQLRQIVKAQYSTLLFRAGVFSDIVPGLTVFIRERTPSGDLRGLMIHDSRDPAIAPATIMAKRGGIVFNESGQQVIVYDGTRQDINRETGVLNRLEFERYTIDLPDGGSPVHQRWREPQERTLQELFNPDRLNERDMASRHEFMVEIHKRLVAPLMAPALTVMALAFLLVGPVDRRGQGWRIVMAIIGTVAIQGLYLSAFSLAQKNMAGLVLMYAALLLPLGAGLFMLSSRSEMLRYRVQQKIKGGWRR